MALAWVTLYGLSCFTLSTGYQEIQRCANCSCPGRLKVSSNEGLIVVLCDPVA